MISPPTIHGAERWSWSPDDSWVAYVHRSTERVHCVEADTGRELFEWDPPRFWRGVFVAALSPDALLVVTRGRDEVRVFALAVPDGGVQAESRFDAAPGDIVVEASADGSTAAVLSGLTHDAKDRGHFLTWLDTRSLTVVGRERLQVMRGDRMRRMAMHPDGSWAAWVNPQQAQSVEERREVERVDRAGVTWGGPVFKGSGDLRSVRWVDADRLLLAVEPEAVPGPNPGWTRVLLTDPARARVLFDGEREARRVGTGLVFSGVDVHPEDGRLLLSWTDRLADPREAGVGTATVLNRSGDVLATWQTKTRFVGAYGAAWAGEGDAVVELVATGGSDVAVQRRDGFEREPRVVTEVRLERERAPSRPEVSAGLAVSPRRRWLDVTWSLGRWETDSVSWVPMGG